VISAEQFKQAAWNSDFEMVKRFVEAGGDIHACGNNGVGALVTFNTEILDYLVSHGASPAMHWDDGSPAIGFYAWEVNLESFKWFLEQGVDPDIQHLVTGENCLHSLCAKPLELDKRLVAIRLLIDHGIDVNRKTKTGIETGGYMRDVCVVGETALHRAAAYQSREVIELLLQAGADKTLKDSHGESTLSWASRHWRERDILKLLLYGKYEDSII